MDTTPKYILMCEKAVEIQKLKEKFILFDKSSFALVTDERYDRNFISIGEMSYFGDEWKWKVDVWLPRQDQLQEIVGSYLECMKIISSSLEFLDPIDWTEFDTMEQLWLAFVMKEKYNKVWSETKKDWIEDGGV